MNTDQTPPPEAPAGHEIITPEFASHKVGDSVQFFLSGGDVPHYGTIQSIDDHGMAIVHSGDLDFVRDLCALSRPIQWHNPDNLASAGEPPWRFLVEGEEKQDGDEYWYPYGETPKWQLANPVNYLNWTNNAATYRTRRPLSQKGEAQPISPVGDATSPVVDGRTREGKSASELDTGTAETNVTIPVPSGETLLPSDARPWLEIAEYDREKHGEWVEGRWGITEDWDLIHREEGFWYANRRDRHASVPLPTHFRLPAPSVPTSGTPKTDAVVFGCGHYCDLPEHNHRAFVTADFARTLESELAEALKRWNNIDGDLSKEHDLNRKLRAEIRVLWQRLRDANRGAERWVGISYGKCKENNELRDALKAAQARVDVAERERDQAHAVFDALYGDARPPAKVHRPTAVEAFVFKQYAEALDTCHKVAAERDTALAELAELKAKMGEKV